MLKVNEELIIKLREGKATIKDKEDIYISFVKFASAIASDYRNRLPQKFREDIYGEARYGLTLAIEEAPSKMYDNNFKQFAKFRIITIIRNFIRKETKHCARNISYEVDEATKIDFGQNIFDLSEEINKIFEKDQHKIVIKYLMEGYSQREIGKELGVSEQRICNICREIKARILERELV